MISAAPLTFVILALLMAGVMYLVSAWYHSGRLETLRGRIDMRDDQIKDYKDRLGGATPDQAKARMDDLQRRLEAVEAELPIGKSSGQRASQILSNDRKRALLKEIAGLEQHTPTIWIVRSGGEPHSEDLAFKFRNFFDETKVQPSMGYLQPDPGQRGVMVVVQNVDNPGDAPLYLHKALTAAGIDAKIVPMPRDSFKSPWALFIGPLDR